MGALIFKDFRTTRFYLGLILPSILLFVTQSLLLPSGFFESYILLILAAALSPMIVEAVNGAEATICCFPLRRDTIVFARYLYGVIVTFLTAPFCLLHLLLADLLLTSKSPFSNPFSSWAGWTMFLVVPLGLQAILLPSVFALGVLRGSLAFGAFLLLGLIALGTTTGLEISEVLQTSPFLSGTDYLIEAVGIEGPVLLLGIWGLLALLLIASMGAALRAYARREF